ncbi:MAG: chemotaxis protein CheB [Rubrobacteraceae bacterium]
MTKDRSFSHLVVVGSSAGGIEALSQLVSVLPEDFPAPIVIAQHLDPNSESHLKEILSRKSALPVRTVTDHDPLEAGVVFVVPANRHVNVSDSEIELVEDGAGRPMPSVDRLMESAAGIYGECLIAVVLTGTGTDGTQGARAVRRAGGTVVVQDPESAEFRGMPASIGPNTVDIVARLDRIGVVLRDLLSGVEADEGPGPEEERQSLEQFLEELREQRGMDFTSYKTPTILRRLKRRMVATETLNGMPVGLVVVDRRYDIQAINAAARRIFSIHGVAVGEDLLHLLRNVPYAEVRRAIDVAFRDGEYVRTEDFTVEDPATGESRYLQISCRSQRDEGEEGPAWTVVVMINDITDIVENRHVLEERLEETQRDFEQFRSEVAEETSRRKGQNERLVETNRQLEEANRELNGLNDELRVTNEESMLSTEEAQAAAEEVETLNEELQATNEELETLNEELQATVEELNVTNDDLQARSVELQDFARTREQERQESEKSRQRLEATLRSMSDSVLAVGPEGEVLFCNDAFIETFGEIRDDESAAELLGNFALLDEKGEGLAHEKTPRVRAARGESFDMRFAVADEGGTRRLFDARARSIEVGETNGGVIVIREIVG